MNYWIICWTRAQLVGFSMSLTTVANLVFFVAYRVTCHWGRDKDTQTLTLVFFWWFWYVLDYAVCRVKECWSCCINVCALSWTCMTCHWKAWGFVGCIMASYVSLHSFLVRKSFLQPWCCVWSSGLWSLFRCLTNTQYCLVWSTFLLDCIESWGVPEFFVGRFITGRASTVSFGNSEILLANR